MTKSLANKEQTKMDNLTVTFLGVQRDKRADSKPDHRVWWCHLAVNLGGTNFTLRSH
jgi:hypothetical protein